jgi:hypothetical protein
MCNNSLARLRERLTTCWNTIYFPAKSRICEPAPGSKSLLVLFFRKEQDSSFSEEKEAKRLLLSHVVLTNPGLGRRATLSGMRQNFRHPGHPAWPLPGPELA